MGRGIWARRRCCWRLLLRRFLDTGSFTRLLVIATSILLVVATSILVVVLIFRLVHCQFFRPFLLSFERTLSLVPILPSSAQELLHIRLFQRRLEIRGSILDELIKFEPFLIVDNIVLVARFPFGNRYEIDPFVKDNAVLPKGIVKLPAPFVVIRPFFFVFDGSGSYRNRHAKGATRCCILWYFDL